MTKTRSCIDDDGNARELDEDWFREAKPAAEVPELAAILKANGKWGRPPLPESERERRVALCPGRNVPQRLKEGGRGRHTPANAGVRKVPGL